MVGRYYFYHYFVRVSKDAMRREFASDVTNPITDFSRHTILEKSLKFIKTKKFYKKWVNVNTDKEVNMARNIYILTELFRFDLDKVKNLERLRNIRALEVLVQLNVVDKLILKDNLNNKHELMQKRLIFHFYPVLDDIKWLDIERNDVALMAKLLTSIGCDDFCMKRSLSRSVSLFGVTYA